MDMSRLQRVSSDEWRIEPEGAMRVPGILFAGEHLIQSMDDKVAEQLVNVASLPGIVGAAYTMPDAHWGYGFPIGGVAAFDPDEGGVVSAGGVGFDISCGVRALTTGLTVPDIKAVADDLADALFGHIPAGVGSEGAIRLDQAEMDAMLQGGARWAVDRGYGREEDLAHIEDLGRIEGAVPAVVSDRARRRQRDEMGTLGSGNHYLEVQRVMDIFAPEVAEGFGIAKNDVLVTIHCGSRGLGHQIGTEYLRDMLNAAPGYGVHLPDRELACAPIKSPLGERYIGAMRSAMNCALANRQIITHLTREVFARVLPSARLNVLYDVSHNTCKEETHEIDGKARRLYVHRKGATRAFGPGIATLPPAFRSIGQPVLIGGSMGTESYVLVGTTESMTKAYGSACHGAGRSMSRRQASKQWRGRKLVDDLRERGIIIKSVSDRGVAEEAPGAYKDVSEVVESAERAGLARRVARLEPLVCIKG